MLVLLNVPSVIGVLVCLTTVNNAIFKKKNSCGKDKTGLLVEL